MTSLLDITEAAPGEVTIRGTKVPVVGLTARDIAGLLTRFQGLQEVMDGRPLTVQMIATSVPEAIGAIGAIGTGRPGDPKIEEKMSSLKLDEQLKVLSAIMRETFGEHADPLVQKLKGLGTNAARGATGKGRVLTSQLPSKDSLRSATTPEMFGGTHRGNSEASPS